MTTPLIAYYDHRKGFFRHGWIESTKSTPKGEVTTVRTIFGTSIKVPACDVHLNS